MVRLAAMAAVAYILGSVPFGYLVGRARGVDLRKVGSGNIGSTNIYRALGFRFALLVFALDAGKGLLAVRVIPRLASGALAPDHTAYLRLVAALAVIIGSLASVFMRARGGKGVATGAGAFLGLEPVATLIAIGIWAGLVAAFKIVSVGSLAAAAALPVLVAGLGDRERFANPDFYLALVVAALVVLSHRTNIGRLARGEEKRVGRERRSEPDCEPANKPAGDHPTKEGR